MSASGAVKWAKAHPSSADLLLAALLVMAAVIAVVVSAPAGVRHPDGWAVLLVIATVAPIAWRRRRPDLVLVASGTVSLVADAAHYAWGFAWPALVVATYSYARHRARHWDVWAAVVWLIEIPLHIPLASTRQDPASIVGLLALSAGAWIAGDGLRARGIERHALIGRAEQAERDREARARQAVAEERTRIARELHDVVAHALGVVVMQAAGARRKRNLDINTARESLATIETTTRDAFGEMRRLVGILRDDGETADIAPQPAVADIPSLVNRLQHAGLDVSLACDGEPCVLSSGVELSAYRIVQEALTNAVNHAPGARVTVKLTWSTSGIMIDVTNGAAPGDIPRPTVGVGGGHGLVGMHERTQLFGGRFDAGPRPDGGFAVHATLPNATGSR